MREVKGFFITLEGGEGSGKSVQAKRLYSSLNRIFPDSVVLTREPGGSESAEDIRNLLLKGSTERHLPISEVLLFYAARYDHLHRKIIPELEKGKIVICDRYIDSSVVYQGIAKQIPLIFFNYLHEMLGFSHSKNINFIPDRTYILDIDPKIGVLRSNARQKEDIDKEDRFEQLSLEFHENVRNGYLSIADKNKERCKIIDANRTEKLIHDEIFEDLTNLIDCCNFFV